LRLDGLPEDPFPFNECNGDVTPAIPVGQAKLNVEKGLHMTGRLALLLGTSLIVSLFFWAQRCAAAELVGGPIVRIAELEIDPVQVEAYKLALKEEIETSIRVEPGVLTLYAVSVKEHPEQIRLFETYRDVAAYESHLQSPHFKTYKDRTRQMVKQLRLIETEPILLGSKSR
jgi:quinol monooxygenase YgiN